MMVGAILSWGIMWPLIGKRAGDWYPPGLSSTDFTGLFGYKVSLDTPLDMPPMAVIRALLPYAV